MKDLELYERLFGGIEPELLAAYCRYVRKNPAVWREFKRLAHEWRAAGNQKCSHWLLANVLRWQSGIQTTGEPYKLRNEYITLLARSLVYTDPSFDGFFQLQKLD